MGSLGHKVSHLRKMASARVSLFLPSQSKSSALVSRWPKGVPEMSRKLRVRTHYPCWFISGALCPKAGRWYKMPSGHLSRRAMRWKCPINNIWSRPPPNCDSVKKPTCTRGKNRETGRLSRGTFLSEICPFPRPFLFPSSLSFRAIRPDFFRIYFLPWKPWKNTFYEIVYFAFPTCPRITTEAAMLAF